MTVAELIAWLQTKPLDAEVSPERHCVLIERDGFKHLEFNYTMKNGCVEFVDEQKTGAARTPE